MWKAARKVNSRLKVARTVLPGLVGTKNMWQNLKVHLVKPAFSGKVSHAVTVDAFTIRNGIFLRQVNRRLGVPFTDPIVR